jgi:hypothetical protein
MYAGRKTLRTLDIVKTFRILTIQCHDHIVQILAFGIPFCREVGGGYAMSIA